MASDTNPSSFASEIPLSSDTIEPERLDLASGEKTGYPAHRRAGGTELERDSGVDTDDAGPKVIDMGHSDIELQVNNTVFKTHAHLLAKFARFEDFINTNSSSDTTTRSIRLDRDKRGAEDMTNTFKILYASVIVGPFEFEPQVLISALRIATVYGYPALRTFAVEHLEKANLGPIQRIELAREFGLTSWEVPAYNELYTRDEALTDQEAQMLGVTAFAKVARMREREKLKIGREMGKQEFKGALERGETSLIEENKQAKAQAEETKRRQREAKDQEGQKREKSGITADEALRWYREALTREAREQKERQKKTKEEEGERERERKEAVERGEKGKKEKIQGEQKDKTEDDKASEARDNPDRDEGVAGEESWSVVGGGGSGFRPFGGGPFGGGAFGGGSFGRRGSF